MTMDNESSTMHKEHDRQMSTQDPSDRRKRQNRMAQRNHRQKVKQRIFDLERLLDDRYDCQYSADPSTPESFSFSQANISSSGFSTSPALTDYTTMSVQQSHGVPWSKPVYLDSQCYDVPTNNVVSARAANPSLLDAANGNAAMPPFQSLNTALESASVPAVLAVPSIEQDFLTSFEPLTSRTDYTSTNLGTRNLQHAPAEEKIVHIVNYARSVGYANFDSLATEYYTTKFPISSNASTLQRISRRRHLRGFLDQLRQSTQTWHEYEIHDYQSEVLKAAEDICRAELDKHMDKVQMQELSNDHETSIWKDCIAGSESEYFMLMEKSKLQNGLPHLWSLVSELTSHTTVQSNANWRVCLLVVALIHYSRRSPINPTGFPPWILLALQTLL